MEKYNLKDSVDKAVVKLVLTLQDRKNVQSSNQTSPHLPNQGKILKKKGNMISLESKLRNSMKFNSTWRK